MGQRSCSSMIYLRFEAQEVNNTLCLWIQTIYRPRVRLLIFAALLEILCYIYILAGALGLGSNLCRAHE